jgi:hypothetical protein
MSESDRYFRLANCAFACACQAFSRGDSQSHEKARALMRRYHHKFKMALSRKVVAA